MEKELKIAVAQIVGYREQIALLKVQVRNLKVVLAKWYAGARSTLICDVSFIIVKMSDEQQHQGIEDKKEYEYIIIDT